MLQQPPSSSTQRATQEAENVGRSLERTAERLEDRAVEGIHGLKLRVESGLENQRSRMLERTQHLREALSTAQNQLEPEEASLGELFAYANEGLDRASRYLSDADPERVRRDAAELARRRPGLVFGGALLIGLVAGRLLRAAEASGGAS